MLFINRISNLQFISLVMQSRCRLYGSWKHGKRLVESRNGAFNGQTTSLVRENGIEYCTNNGANNVMAIQSVPQRFKWPVAHTNSHNVLSEMAANPVHISYCISRVFLLWLFEWIYGANSLIASR